MGGLGEDWGRKWAKSGGDSGTGGVDLGSSHTHQILSLFPGPGLPLSSPQTYTSCIRSWCRSKETHSPPGGLHRGKEKIFY